MGLVSYSNRLVAGWVRPCRRARTTTRASAPPGVLDRGGPQSARRAGPDCRVRAGAFRAARFADQQRGRQSADADLRCRPGYARHDLVPQLPAAISPCTASRPRNEGPGGGSTVNISSINSLVGVEDLSVYGPTKAALSQLTTVMAIKWARFGIRANAIAPGFLATPMNEGHWFHATRGPWIIDRIPMCRPGQPAELVGACQLLVSHAGSYITGQTLVVDGGHRRKPMGRLTGNRAGGVSGERRLRPPDAFRPSGRRVSPISRSARLSDLLNAYSGMTGKS